MREWLGVFYIPALLLLGIVALTLVAFILRRLRGRSSCLRMGHAESQAGSDAFTPGNDAGHGAGGQ